MTKTEATPRFPKGIPYIVGNEICERFSFYGMKAILVVFITDILLKSERDAKTIYHLFIQAAYFLPLLGAFLADRFWGKYRTIMILSVVYCLGHLTLAIWENESGLYWGLALIALGAGGIKPCVSAHVGDQFDETNQTLLDRIFSIFYFSINFGAFFSSLLTPWVLKHYGAQWAFGIPGLLMGLATLVFWMGRHRFISVPPTGKEGPAGYLTVSLYALKNRRNRPAGKDWLEAARDRYSEAEVEAVRAANGIFKVFATVTIFWSLFDQQGSSWTLQAKRMDLTVWGMQFEASQVQAINPILVMLLIPVFSYGIYPAFEKLGIRVTALRKMSVGMVLAAISFVIIGLIQVAIDQGQTPSILWQVLAYAIITCSEVMVSITGLEFAYTQAPRAMKSTIMSFWLLTVAGGNFLAAVVSQLNRFSGPGEFFGYAGLMGLVSIVFVWGAMRYRERNFIEARGSQPLEGQSLPASPSALAASEATGLA
jgi:POT family proton-dependent oligopeptide transporter